MRFYSTIISRCRVSARHFLRKKSSFFKIGVFLSSLYTILVISYTSLSGSPADAELRFAEKSPKSGVLGGMLPASCESAPWYTANGDGNFTNCIPPVVTNFYVTPTNVPYGGSYSSLTLESVGATDCTIYYTYGPDSGSFPSPSPNYVWGVSGPLLYDVSYAVQCLNSTTGMGSNWGGAGVTVTPTPTVNINFQ